MTPYEVSKEVYDLAKTNLKGMVFHRKAEGKHYIKCYDYVAKHLGLI